MTATTTTRTTEAGDVAARLRATVRCPVITPWEPEYDAARRVRAGGFDLRPAAVVRVTDADDVAAAIAVGRETGAALAVRSGGHSGAGHGSVDGGIVIDLRGLSGLEIDPVTATAWAGAGLTAAEVTAAAAEHGLAVGFGDTGSVGIGGITLGGGIGYLVRKHGLTIDSLLAAEVVTADGLRLEVDEQHHPDLFWALRGGGGNFGVVTRFRYRLHPVEQVLGGMLVVPATAASVERFMAVCEAAPDELSVIANVMPCPPMPFVPEDRHGDLVIMAFVCYAGDPAEGERAVAPLRAVAEPIADLVRAIRYPEMYAPEGDQDGGEPPIAAARTLFLDHVDAAMAGAIVAALEASDASMRAVQLRVLGGAMASVPAEATAFAHRASRVMGVVVAFADGPEDAANRARWVDDLVAAMDQGDPGAYVNFLGDEGAERVRAAYPPATWQRLAAVKARYDPTNLLRRNQNIPPAA
jgi:FAD/FMN-containing dehydrogenase